MAMFSGKWTKAVIILIRFVHYIYHGFGLFLVIRWTNGTILTEILSIWLVCLSQKVR